MDVVTEADVPELPVAPRVIDVQNSTIMLSWGYREAMELPSGCTDARRLETVSVCYTETVAGSSEATINCTLGSLPSAENFTLAVEAINVVGSSNISVSGLYCTRSAHARISSRKSRPLPGLSAKNTIRVVWTSPFANGCQ